MAKKSKQARETKKLKYKTRYMNRCLVCSRQRAYMRKFGMCRMCFRKYAHKGDIPGVRKASW